MKYAGYSLFSVFFAFVTAPLWLQIVDPVWDASDFYYPAFTYLADSIREGRFPLWDPYTNCGDPFHADPQKMTLSPIALAIGFCVGKTSLGFVLLWLVHWWWAGIGMLWLARANGAGNAGALVAAVSYSFSGFFIGHAEHTPYVVLAAWLPWILGLADQAVAQRRPSYVLFAAFSFGFCALSGGYPVLVAFTGMAVALWLTLRHLVRAEPSWASMSRRIQWIALTLLVMGVVLAGILAPILNAFFTEGRDFTDRLAPVASDVANYGHPFSHRSAVSLVFPFATILFSSLTPAFGGSNWMLADVSMTNAYMGALAIPLACVWWVRNEDRLRPWWMLVFILFMFFVSLGGDAGLRVALNVVLPPLKYMRYNAPFRLFWILPLCLAAGLGFSLLLRRHESRRSFFRILLVWCALAGAVAVVCGGVALRRGLPLPAIFPRLYMPGLIVLPLALVCVYLWMRKGADAAGRLLPLLVALVVLADMGGHLLNNRKTVWSRGCYPVSELDERHQRGTTTQGSPGARSISGGPMNKQQILKQPVISGYVAFAFPPFNDVLCRSRFAEVLSASERFWVVPGIEKPSTDEEALRTLCSTGKGEPAPVFVGAATAPLQTERVTPGSYGLSQTVFYSPEEIRLAVDVPPGTEEAFLTSTERYAAGWKVWVDGTPQKVWKSNMFFRGVFLPEGRHTVIWRYQPHLWSPLVILSYVVLSVSLLLACLFMFQEQRPFLGRHKSATIFGAERFGVPASAPTRTAPGGWNS